MFGSREDARERPEEGIGWLAAKGFRAACTVEDISASGARVHIRSIRLSRPRALPDTLTLTTVLGGQQVTVPGGVTQIERGDDGLCLGIRFFNGDAAGLDGLINRAHRAGINRASER